jgi:hypothetical protein
MVGTSAIFTDRENLPLLVDKYPDRENLPLLVDKYPDRE